MKTTKPWQKTVEPYASAWKRVHEEATGHGLIHGMRVHAILSEVRNNTAPADAADLLRCMVEHGAMRPAAKDLAGAGISARAFRGLQYSASTDSKPAPYPEVDQWLNSFPSEPADGHLWTFEAVKDQA